MDNFIPEKTKIRTFTVSRLENVKKKTDEPAYTTGTYEQERACVAKGSEKLTRT